MNDPLLNIIWFIAGVLLITILNCLSDGYSDGYRNGQIDVLSNKSIKYELVVNKDKTSEWKLIKGEDNCG